MKKAEGLDCVEMKTRIQRTLARSQAGRSRAALNAAAQRRIAADPHLSRLLEAAPRSAPAKKAG